MVSHVWYLKCNPLLVLYKHCAIVKRNHTLLFVFKWAINRKDKWNAYILILCLGIVQPHHHHHHTFTIPSRINDVTAYCHRGRKPPRSRAHLLLWVLASRTCHVVLHIRVPSLGHLPKKEIKHVKFLHLGFIVCDWIWLEIWDFFQ